MAVGQDDGLREGLNPILQDYVVGDLPVGQICVQPPLQKYLASRVGQIISTSSRHPTPQEGRIMIVTDAGRGAVDAAAFCARWDCRAGWRKACERFTKRADEGCCSVRRSRVVLTPRRWRQVRGVKSAQPGLDKNISVGDGGKTARSPGRARRKPLKPLRAGTSGDSGVLVYSCAFYQYKVHTRLRVPRASGVPHALFGRKIYQRLGRMARRGREMASGIRKPAFRAR